jgi:hypothetical protein
MHLPPSSSFSIQRRAATILILFPETDADPTGWIAPTVLLVAAALTLSCCRVIVTIDHRAFTVTSSIFRFRWKELPLREIDGHGVESQGALSWGGWGYRWTPGRSALILASGPGLTLNLANGQLFSVTLAEAARASAELDRRGVA